MVAGHEVFRQAPSDPLATQCDIGPSTQPPIYPACYKSRMCKPKIFIVEAATPESAEEELFKVDHVVRPELGKDP